MKRSFVFVGFIVLLPVIAFSADVNLTQDGRVPGAPFQALQQQIDALNAKLNALFNQACPEGQFVVGISSTGRILCESLPQPPGETTYFMVCNTTADPFDSDHANFKLEIAPEILGGELTTIAVELSTQGEGGSTAYVELKDVETGIVLATSGVMPTDAGAGWLEFLFAPGFVIDRTRLLVNFVTSDGARMYNCGNTETLVPAGLTAYGMGFSNHMARVYIKIKN